MMLQANRTRLFFPMALLLAAAAVIALLFVAQGAAANQRVENDGQVPFYARFGEGETFSDGQWTVIVFYRPPSCIPADFNMMQFFDFPGPGGPGAFACQPSTTDGFEIWEGEPQQGPAPKQAKLWGKGAVPIWFVNSADLQGIIDENGVVTIGDLMALSPLMGEASTYNETLHPSQSNDTSLVNIKARGTLQDGGTFKVILNYVNGDGLTKIELDQ